MEAWIGQYFWTLVYDNWTDDEYCHLTMVAESAFSGPNRARLIDYT